MAKQLTDERYDKAAEKLLTSKEGIKVPPVRLVMTAQQEIEYESIPDTFKRSAMAVLAEYTPKVKRLDYREPLLKQGIIALWRNRNGIANAYTLGLEARG